MSEIVFSDDILLTAPDGKEVRFSTLKAQAARSILAKQRSALKKLPEEKKREFYYKAYQILDKHTLLDKSNPFLQAGLSPYTFMNEPLRIGGFDTTYGELFSRLHLAMKEAEAIFDLDK